MSIKFDGIADFIKFLDERGELLRIDKEVSPVIGISVITDAESKKPGGGKALLFENVVDNGKKTFPVATNLFGSEKRMAWALGGESIAEIERKIEDLTRLRPPKGLQEIFLTIKKILPLGRIMPAKFRGKTAPCQEVVKLGDAVDLSEIPVLKCWPKDAGRFVTLPLVFTKSEDSRERNLGMYRLQIFDKSTTGMHWHIHKDASHFFGEYSAKGKRMPVAVAIGADPATVYSATAPMPRGFDELLLAGFLRGKGVKLVKCKTVDLEVPANAEFVIEGYVDPGELRLEGPFGDHTGYYSQADMYPVFHVTALTRKSKPVYCATLVGPPPMEDCYMAKATERIFLPLLKAVAPEICDMFLPWEGVFHNIAVVSIKKEFPAHAQKLASLLWGQGQMSFCKSIVVVDSDVDPSDLRGVWDLFLQNFDPHSDILITDGVLDALDHSAPHPLRGSKLCVDLTRRGFGEDERSATSPKELSESEAEHAKSILEKILGENSKFKFYKGFCAASIEKGSRKGTDILQAVDASGALNGKVRAFAIFDKGVDIENASKILWKIFNNTDPRRDIIISKSGGLCLIDACKKTSADGYTREWPEDLKFDTNA